MRLRTQACPHSDSSLLIRVSTQLEVRQLLKAFEIAKPAGVLNLHPAYGSLMVRFDPCVTSHEQLEAQIEALSLSEIVLPESRTVEIPVVYDGPDLGDVAELHGLTIEDVVRIHSDAIYTVLFLGFVPGFAYLGGLPDRIATPRLPSPRKRVGAGSVGIGGNQTGIYPVTSPGGWRLIGHTPLSMFREDMPLLAIGDTVRFQPFEGV